jgi:hypothetical protein
MTVTIRELQGRDGEYFAYVKSLCGKATYFVHFNDNVWGAVILHNFIEMLKGYFKQNKIEIRVENQPIVIKNEMLLEILGKGNGKGSL